jgi:hypothetical protein
MDFLLLGWYLTTVAICLIPTLILRRTGAELLAMGKISFLMSEFKTILLINFSCASK